jgi:DUF1365 family protein
MRSTDGTTASPAPWRSCLYEGVVRHQRLHPKPYQFDHGVFFFCLDLDEIDSLASHIAGFSRNAFDLYAFWDSDHFPFSGGSLKTHVLDFLSEKGISLGPDPTILLVTLPRVLGYIFNPVSFFFCFDASGAPRCALAEVGNTFGENKLYLLPDAPKDGWFTLRAPKHFYVSPFSALDVEFVFRLRLPEERLEIHIDDVTPERTLLLSSLTGKRRVFSTANLLWLTARYPLVTLRVILLIHWHALRLWWKRIPFHRKSENPHQQQGVLRPHSSISHHSP